MIKYSLWLAIGGFTLLTACQTPNSSTAAGSGEPVELLNEMDSMNYALGMNIGQMFNEKGVDVRADQLVAGIFDAQNDTALIDEAIAKQLVSNAARYDQIVAGKKAVSEGAAFLKDNALKDGVTVTASGLQYEVLAEGNGISPSPSSIVKIHYTGTFLNGKKFDSSYDRGAPTDLEAGRFIPGFTEGLLLMSPGAKYKFVIPGKIGYGPQGNPRAGIAPNETLIFEVEMLDFTD